MKMRCQFFLGGDTGRWEVVDAGVRFGGARSRPRLPAAPFYFRELIFGTRAVSCREVSSVRTMRHCAHFYGAEELSQRLELPFY